MKSKSSPDGREMSHVPVAVPRDEGVDLDEAPVPRDLVFQLRSPGSKVTDLVPFAARRNPLRFFFDLDPAQRCPVPAFSPRVQLLDVMAVRPDQLGMVAAGIIHVLQR